MGTSTRGTDSLTKIVLNCDLRMYTLLNAQHIRVVWIAIVIVDIADRATAVSDSDAVALHVGPAAVVVEVETFGAVRALAARAVPALLARAVWGPAVDDGIALEQNEGKYKA